MREEDLENQKEIQDLRDKQRKLNKQLKEESSCDNDDVVGKLKDRIQKLEEEVELEKEKNRELSKKKDEEESYLYEDDFESESNAGDENSSQRIEEEVSSKRSVEESDVSSKKQTDESSNNKVRKYAEDSFEEESVATLQSLSSIVHGEACEESVPEIESDEDSEKSELFFGNVTQNVCLDVPNFTPASTSQSDHSLKESAPQAVLTKKVKTAHQDSLVSLSEAPPLNKNNPSPTTIVKPNKKTKKSSPANNTITASDIFGVDKKKKETSGKKKKSKNDTNSISAEDIFGTKSTKNKSKKNKSTTKAKNKITADDIFGKPSKKVDTKQNKDLNRDINSILGNL